MRLLDIMAGALFIGMMIELFPAIQSFVIGFLIVMAWPKY